MEITLTKDEVVTISSALEVWVANCKEAIKDPKISSFKVIKEAYEEQIAISTKLQDNIDKILETEREEK